MLPAKRPATKLCCFIRFPYYKKSGTLHVNNNCKENRDKHHACYTEQSQTRIHTDKRKHRIRSEGAAHNFRFNNLPYYKYYRYRTKSDIPFL